MKIITTVGTSIFKNSGEDSNEYSHIFNQQKWDETFYKLPVIESLLRYAQENDNVCAEIASLSQIQQELNSTIEVYLICSYTLDCRIAAEAIKKYFDERNIDIIVKNIICVESLLVSSKKVFELGLSNLFAAIQKIAETGWKDIIFNITGGYKAIIPHLTILGQIQNCPIYYIFNNEEEGKDYELLKVPKLPISFDWAVCEIYGGMLSSSFALINFADEKTFTKLKNYGLAKGENENRQVDTFGNLLWSYIKSDRPENPTLIGSYIELPIYKFFVQNPYKNYNNLPEHSVIFWHNKKDIALKENYSLVNNKIFHQKKAELDFILTSTNNDYAVVEVKSVLQIESLIKVNEKGRIDLENKFSTTKIWYSKPPEEFVLVIYKNSKIPIEQIKKEQNDHFQKISSTCKSFNIKNFSIYCIDIDIKESDIDEKVSIGSLLISNIKLDDFIEIKL